jgi:hypothetical protein
MKEIIHGIIEGLLIVGIFTALPIVAVLTIWGIIPSNIGVRIIFMQIIFTCPFWIVMNLLKVR